MNPLPKIVLLALAICARHVAGVALVDIPPAFDWMPPPTPHHSCAAVAKCAIWDEAPPSSWEAGYGRCARIYAKAAKIQESAAIANAKAYERAAKKRERAKAAKDQPILRAALKALNRTAR